MFGALWAAIFGGLLVILSGCGNIQYLTNRNASLEAVDRAAAEVGEESYEVVVARAMLSKASEEAAAGAYGDALVLLKKAEQFAHRAHERSAASP